MHHGQCESSPPLSCGCCLCFLWLFILHFPQVLHSKQNWALHSAVSCVLVLHLVQYVDPCWSCPVLRASPSLSLSLHACACVSKNCKKCGQSGASLPGVFSQSSLAISVKRGIQLSLTMSSLVILYPIPDNSRFAL